MTNNDHWLLGVVVVDCVAARLSTVGIAVVVGGGGGRIEPTAPMAALLMVAVVDGSSNNGIVTTASHNDNCHPCPHCPHGRVEGAP